MALQLHQAIEHPIVVVDDVVLVPLLDVLVFKVIVLFYIGEVRELQLHKFVLVQLLGKGNGNF